jgi:hypothetical protein
MKGVEMRRRIPPELIEKAGKVEPGMPLAFILALALEVSLQGQRMDRRRCNTLRRILAGGLSRWRGRSCRWLYGGC